MYRTYTQITELLEGAGITAYVGDPSDDAVAPYAVAWGNLPRSQPRTLAGADRSVDDTMNVTCVGTSPAQALQLAQEVTDVLDAAELTIPGWRIFPLRVVDPEDDQSAGNSPENTTQRRPSRVVLYLRVRAVKE